MLKINKSLLALLIFSLAANINAQEASQSAPESTEQQSAESASIVQPTASDVPASAIPKLVAATPDSSKEKSNLSPVEEPGKLEEAAKPSETPETTEQQPEAMQATPTTEQAEAATVPAPAATEAVKPEAGKSQSFEESFGLTPSKPVEAKPLHLPEIAHLDATQGTANQEEPKNPEQAKPEMAPVVKKSATSDEETCTTICKRVCLALKEEDRKKIEEEAPVETSQVEGK